MGGVEGAKKGWGKLERKGRRRDGNERWMWGGDAGYILRFNKFKLRFKHNITKLLAGGRIKRWQIRVKGS